jgi:hypothetical protein
MKPNTNNIEVFYNTFREISKAVHSSTDLKEVLDPAVCKATEALGAKGAILRILMHDARWVLILSNSLATLSSWKRKSKAVPAGALRQSVFGRLRCSRFWMFSHRFH